MSRKDIYKVIFNCENKIYQIYAQQVHQDGMFGFVVLENLIFDKQSSIVVDPTEDILRAKFKDVARTYIPMHAIIRIDQVKKRGEAKITNNPDGNIKNFPIYTKPTDSANGE